MASLRPHATWMTEGLCRQVDPDLWFPRKNGSSKPAKMICRGLRGAPPCPILDRCLAYALEHSEPHGVWGGMSELDRKRIKMGKPVRGYPVS